ncbi:hypothetical protein PVAND_000140 [Polypedilum vanderplanki]|uniref:Uncharacterized protein n=1 Tax=Polypedilum vanderplanki TaxID=319348 RepID=A0A9J6BIX6_POLVA|nr:hypothetical protein PVAND_000140 [Polypedilum vanderplanki]
MASFYMIFSDEDDEEFGDKNNPMAQNDDEEEANVKYSKHYGSDNVDDEKSSATDSENSKISWEVLLAKLVTAYKVINNQNTIIGRTGFAILISDKSQSLKIILYKSKIDLLSSLVLRPSNKIYVKGNFIQYLDSGSNFWSVLFENANDRDEALRLLEERCTIEREQIDLSKPNNEPSNDDTATGNNGEGVKDNENESQENAKNAEDEDGGGGGESTCDKAVETDPEDKQNKHMKANILARMARMGKRLVPSSNKSGSDMSDSSETESSPKHQPRKPIASSSQSPVLQVAKLQPAPQAHSIAQTVEFKHNHSNHGLISAASSDTSLNLMMMQNTEIRFNLSKLDSKLDKLYDKLDVLSTASSVSSSNNDKNNNDSLREEDIVKLEERLVRAKRENLINKSIIRDLEEKLKSVNSHSVDELNELKVQMKALQNENKNISLEVTEKNKHIEILDNKLKHSIAINEEREVQMKAMEADLREIKSQLNISSRYVQDMESTLATIKKQQESNISKETQTEVTKPLENANATVPSEVVIKEIMNSLYFRLCEKISNLNELKHSEVLKIIGTTIKSETSECLRKTNSS